MDAAHGDGRGDMKELSESQVAYTPLPREPPPQRTQALPLLKYAETQDTDVEPEDLISLHNLDLQNRHQRQPPSQSLYQYQDEPKHVDSDNDSLEMAAYGPDTHFVDLQSNAHAVNVPVKEGRKGDKTLLYVALAALATFFVGTLLIVLLNDPSRLGLFAAHPPLQALAITCFGLGILLLQPTSQPKTKARGLTWHQLVILGVGLPSITTGTILVFMNKVIHDDPHFTTWHATFGLIAVVWMVGQMLVGGLSVWFGGRAFGGGMKAKSVWKYHRVSGYLLFPMFLVTAAIGGNYSSWTAAVVSVAVRVLVYTLAPIFALVAIWSRMRLSKMNFR